MGEHERRVEDWMRAVREMIDRQSLPQVWYGTVAGTVLEAINAPPVISRPDDIPADLPIGALADHAYEGKHGWW